MAALEAQGFRVVPVNPTPVGSLHDRACQAFYQLKGGTVCYGQEHSRLHGHDCHGETYLGTIPAWGENCPVHIVGHSYGGQTARVLQHLIATGFFSKAGKYCTSPAWVRSVTACNSPLNGSLLVYSLGEKSDTAPAVRLGSYGHLLSLVIHVLELLDVAFLRHTFNPGLEHFGLSWRRLGLLKAVGELSHAVVGDSSIFSRGENAAFDITVQSARRWNQVIQTDPNTFYFSVCGTTPSKCDLAAAATDQEPGARVSPGALGRTVIKLVYWFLRWTHGRHVREHEKVVEELFGVPAEAWSASGSDGVLEGYTQSHPRVPLECEPLVSVGFTSEHGTLQPGLWHCISCPADHMWTLANKRQAEETFERLARCLLAANSLTAAAIPANRNNGSSTINVAIDDGASLRSRNDTSSVGTPLRRRGRLLGRKRHQTATERPTASRTSTISTAPMPLGRHEERTRREWDGGGGGARVCDMCNNWAMTLRGKYRNGHGKFRDGWLRQAPGRGRRRNRVSRERGLIAGRLGSLVRLLLAMGLLAAVAFCVAGELLSLGDL